MTATLLKVFPAPGTGVGGLFLRRASSVVWSQAMAVAVVVSAAYISYSLGANDVGNAIGPLLSKYPDHGLQPRSACTFFSMAGIPVSTSQAVVGDVEAASEKARLVIEIESRADALEEQIREVLLQGAFLPHMRSDVYRLVEAVDAIAGEGESIARFVFDQSPLIPEQFESRLLDLYRLSLNCFLELRKALKDYFKPKGELEDLHGHVDRVCEIETEVDAAESMLARDIFASELHLAEKIHLEQLVKKIGNIADLSEDASDEPEFAAMKSVV